MNTKFKKAANDPTRFEGDGVNYKAKLIGIEDVKEARGDQMCQEALVKLKNSARIAGGHKRKIIINVSLEGLKITDAVSLISLHAHPVNQISFISRDPADNRAFGYICGTEDGLHKFFAIKTATAAEQVVNALKDLFQVVFENKKKELDAAKEKQDNKETNGNGEKENTAIVGDGSPSADGQTPSPVASSETENGNQSNTKTEVQAEPVANLFDLEDMADNILKGIQQSNSFEFEFLTNDTPSTISSTPTSPAGKVSLPTTTSDPWGLSVTETSEKPAGTSSSALGDLAGLQTGPFTTSFPVHGGFGSSSSFSTVPGGLHGTHNPFGTDPFSSYNKQPAGPGFGVTNPFGAEFNQPYGSQGIPPRMGMVGAYGVMPGMVPRGVMSQPALGVIQNPIGAHSGNPFAEGDSTFGDMGRKDAGPDSSGSDASKARSKSPHDDLFGDLLDIKKSSPTTAKTPRDMFVQGTAIEKKSMNAMMTSGASPRASPVPAIQMKPGISPRASPIPTVQLKPAVSPSASPIPAVQLMPSISPRASPIPAVQLMPGISPRASPIPAVQLLPGISPRASPVPSTPSKLAQSTSFDDPFGAPAQQSTSFDDPFGAPAQQITIFDDPFGAPAQQNTSFDDVFGGAVQKSTSFDDAFGAPVQKSTSFDDSFGAPVHQNPSFDAAFGASDQKGPSFDDAFGAPVQKSTSFDDAFGAPVQQVSDISLLD